MCKILGRLKDAGTFTVIVNKMLEVGDLKVGDLKIAVNNRKIPHEDPFLIQLHGLVVTLFLVAYEKVSQYL